MDSSLKRMTIFMVVIMFAVVAGTVFYANKDLFMGKESQETSAEIVQEEDQAGRLQPAGLVRTVALFGR